jgi:histidinol-phosphatase (PHP family)
MLHNYHTHTLRCNHALGTDREYVEAAIQKGLKTLGFSDHAPFLSGYDTYASFRMGEDSMYEYAESVRALQKEYEKDIRILCGFELEYYPEYHKEKMAFLKKVNPDYIILGQHFIGNEKAGLASSQQFSSDFALVAYVNQIISAIDTGDFLYIAHPEIVGMKFTDEVIEREYTRLCKAAKTRNVPLEINFLGLRGNRHYPNKRFWEIVAKVGNEVVFGIDAHSPDSILEENAEKTALEMVENLHLKLVDKLL